MKPLRILVLALVLTTGCDLSPEAAERSDSRDVINLCWKNQSAKSLGPAEARFIAGACEKLEADYRAKWHREP